MITLGIETSGILCSIAWYSNQRVLLEYNIEKPQIHTTLLASLVQKGFDELELSINDINLVAIATGPGSYTGLRIGMSYCKGLCYGKDIPLIGISNFEVMNYQAPYINNPVLTLINANRGRYYFARFETESTKILEKGIVSEQEVEKFDTSNLGVIMDYSSKIDQNTVPWKNFKWTHRVRFNAAFLCQAAEKRYNLAGTDSLDDIEPLYLQAFAGVI